MGPSGVGKSDLAIRLIDGGAILVSDDQTEIRVQDGQLLASPPASIEGLIEVRYVGLVHAPFCRDIPISYAIELLSDVAELDRLPTPETYSIGGVDVPLFRLWGHAPSAPAIIRLLGSGSYLQC